MGVIKVDSMKNMALEAELDVEGRKLTNHSVRKKLVKKLKASNQSRSAIIGVTGHTSERSLADWEEGDEAEQRQILSIISSPVGQQVQNWLSLKRGTGNRGTGNGERGTGNL